MGRALTWLLVVRYHLHGSCCFHHKASRNSFQRQQRVLFSTWCWGGFLSPELDVLQIGSRSHQQLWPSIFWLFAHPIPEFLSLHLVPWFAATDFCRLLVLTILALFFKAIPSDSFNLRYCCGKYASREQFHRKKCLSDLIYIVACPLKLD